MSSCIIWRGAMAPIILLNHRGGLHQFGFLFSHLELEDHHSARTASNGELHAPG